MNNTAKDKITLKLCMVPVVALPAAAAAAAATARPVAPTAALTSKKPGLNTDKLMRQFCVMAIIALLSVGCYFTISHYFVETVQVVGKSMVPTLQENNHYLLNRWAFHNREPQRRDVVVIRDPADHGYSVKRIVAGPGESVLFKSGKVYVNNKEILENYLSPDTLTFTYKKAHELLVMCGKDQYFVLGDNRSVSIDSREYGPVPRENILGLLMVK